MVKLVKGNQLAAVSCFQGTKWINKQIRQYKFFTVRYTTQRNFINNPLIVTSKTNTGTLQYEQCNFNNLLIFGNSKTFRSEHTRRHLNKNAWNSLNRATQCTDDNIRWFLSTLHIWSNLKHVISAQTNTTKSNKNYYISKRKLTKIIKVNTNFPRQSQNRCYRSLATFCSMPTNLYHRMKSWHS